MLDDNKNFSADLVMAWAEMTVQQWEFDDYESQMSQTKKDEEAGVLEIDETTKASNELLLYKVKQHLKEKKNAYAYAKNALPKVNKFQEQI
jgi:hypothetical protein